MAISKLRVIKIVRALADYMEKNPKSTTLSHHAIKMRVTAVNKDAELSKTAIALQYKMNESKMSTDILVLGGRIDSSREDYLYTPNVARVKLSSPRYTFAEADDIVFPYHLQIEFLDKEEKFCCGAGDLIESMRGVARNHVQLKNNPKYREAVHRFGLDFIRCGVNVNKYLLWMEMMRRVGIIDHVMTQADGIYPIAVQGDYIYFQTGGGDYEVFKQSFAKSHYTRHFTLDGFGTLLTARGVKMLSLESKTMRCEDLGFVKYTYRCDVLRNHIWSIL